MKDELEKAPSAASAHDERIRDEIDKANARIRHFRAVAANVLGDALGVLDDIRQICGEQRTPCEILLDEKRSSAKDDKGPRNELMEKLHLLKHYLEYTRRLCDGSI